MKKTFFALLLFSLLSCSKITQESRFMWTCNCQEQLAAATWIGNHIEAANNRSDEEMEDVIKQLQETAIKLHCRQRTITGSFESDRLRLISTNVDSLAIFDY